MQVLTNTFFPSFRGMIVDTFFIDRDSDLIQGDTKKRKNPSTGIMRERVKTNQKSLNLSASLHPALPVHISSTVSAAPVLPLAAG